MVHDDNESHHTIRRLLEHMGINVKTLTEPQHMLSCLNDARQTDEPYKIAIFDHTVAHISGAELGKEIRQDPKLDELKLLIFSSIADKGDAAHFARSGFNACLNKLTRYDSLKVVLTAMLSHQLGQDVITQHSIEEVAQPAKEFKFPKGVRVLLVEDLKPNQIVAKTFLSKMGFEVEVANNGEEAINAFNTLRFDLILMDCRMPVMDGYEATQSIRALEKKKDCPPLPIIALTANASSDDRVLCMQSGMNDVITKPFKRADLSSCLQKWLAET